MIKRFEHLIIKVDETEDYDIDSLKSYPHENANEQALDEIAILENDSWELVSMTGDSTCLILAFKRPFKQKKKK